MAHLKWIKEVLQPTVAVSENVTTGNIGQRIVEQLSDTMTSRVTWNRKYRNFFRCRDLRHQSTPKKQTLDDKGHTHTQTPRMVGESSMFRKIALYILFTHVMELSRPHHLLPKFANAGDLDRSIRCRLRMRQ